MDRIAVRLVVVLTVILAGAASGETPMTQLSQSDVRRDAQDVAGHWNGRMEPARLSAEIDLHLQRAGTSWKAEMTFHAGPDVGSLPIEELRVDGNGVLVRTKIEGAAVSLELTIEDDLMLGSVRVMESGRVLAEGPAGLARATDASGGLRLIRWLDARSASIDARRRDTVIERATELLLANYVSQERAERAVAAVRERAKRGEYDSVTAPARLAELLGRHLAEATGDRHVQMKVGAERSHDPLAGTVETTVELAQLRRDAEAEKFGIGASRVLQGNVGYLEFKRFFRAELAGNALAAGSPPWASRRSTISASVLASFPAGRGIGTTSFAAPTAPRRNSGPPPGCRVRALPASRSTF